MITVSKRMETVISMVTKGNKVADIGTDHGYVPIALIQRGIAPQAIAMDVRKGPLQKAKENRMAYQMEERIEIRLSDGLQQLKAGEVDTIIIAGMGGVLIARILKEGETIVQSVKELIVQPQSEIYKVRKQLHELGFQIVKEEMLIEEGKYYTVMKAVAGRQTYKDEVEYFYGKLLLEERNPILYQWLEKEYCTTKELYKKIEYVDSPAAIIRKEELLHTLELIKGGIAYYES